jgi:hypothetical protein
MDPDMNKYALSDRVTHHVKMSDAEWEGAYRAAWKSYYNAEHVETVIRRAVASGSPAKKVVWPLLWFWATHEIEGVHPVEAGYIRLKSRTERRPGMPIENPLIFYPKYVANFLWKGAHWLHLFWTVRQIARRVEADPRRFEYMDASLTPAVDDREAFDALEMIHTHAKAANKLQRAHIDTHEEERVPLEAAE